MKLKNVLVFVSLFIIPALIYFYFSSGIYHFARLPIHSPAVEDVVYFKALDSSSISLENKVSVVAILGSEVVNKGTDLFNLGQIIYKRFEQYEDFQLVLIIENGEEENIERTSNELKERVGLNLEKWLVVVASSQEINSFYKSLNLSIPLSEYNSLDNVFIIDKEFNLRGSKDLEDFVGYNATDISTLNDTMLDDMKVIMAEYRMAFKSNETFIK